MRINFLIPVQDRLMKTDLFFYTGTGNSLWTARKVANELGNADIIPIPWISSYPFRSRADAIGIIFPVHIWGLPQRVIAFVNSLAVDTSKYYFALAVNAGQVAATLLQMNKLMKSRDLFLSAGFDIVMPSNYIPWGGPGPKSKCMKRINDSKEKIRKISTVIANRERSPVEKGPLWQNILFSWFYKLSFPYIPAMDKKFWVDDKCNNCNICMKVCSCGNIDMQAGKAVWLHHCEQCLACIQWCPKEAIQYGKNTSRYERYHHPEIKLEDIISLSHKETNSSESAGVMRDAK